MFSYSAQVPRAVSTFPLPAASPRPLLIEQACPTDALRLLQLEQVVFDPALAFHRKQLEAILRNPRATVWMLQQHKELVGQLILLRRKTRSGCLARVYSLAIHPLWRGQGLARSLLQFGLEGLWMEGVYRVILEVEDAAQPARQLYDSLGFKVIADLHDYYAPGRHGLKMELRRPSPLS